MTRSRLIMTTVMVTAVATITVVVLVSHTTRMKIVWCQNDRAADPKNLECVNDADHARIKRAVESFEASNPYAIHLKDK
jgi:hypothetical protein